VITINKKYFSIYLFLLILLLALTGCSQNPTTGNFGPSWEMIIELPVTKSEDTFNNLIEADQFDNMGLSTTASEIESFYVIGTKEKPIKKNLSFNLPELSITLENNIDKSTTIPIVNGQKNESLDLSFPKMTFGSSSTGNSISITITNKDSNVPIDNIIIELWDKNSSESEYIAQTTFNDISNSQSKNLSLNDAVINEDGLELKIKYDQSSGMTEADITIYGLKDITIKKIENVKVDKVDSPSFDSMPVEMGIFDSIEGYPATEDAQLAIAVTPPESLNMELIFDEILINGVNYNTKDGDHYLWSGSPINLGTAEFSGKLTSNENDGIISYDATDSGNISVTIEGKAAITSKSDFPSEYDLDQINVVDGDLTYEIEPMPVEIKQENINTIREGIIDLDHTYLETIINNETNIELAAEIFIGSDQDNLYTNQNKISQRIIEVRKGENEPKQFLLENTIDKVEETLTEGNVYMGIKFIIGELDNNSGSNINFTDNLTLDIESLIAVKVLINQ